MRWSLFGEIFTMAWDTLRGNKLRSALTVLGVVIGITSIVGMTSLIRGFDQSFRDLIRGIGPDTIFIAKFSGVSLSSGAKLQDLLRAPERHARRRGRDRASCAVDRARRHQPRRRRLRRRPAADVLPRPAHQAAHRIRHDREVSVREPTRGRRRPLLHDSGGRAPSQGRRARPDRVHCAVPDGGSDRQGRARRARGVRGGRRHGEAAQPGRLQPRPGRLRHPAAHGLPEAVRHPRQRHRRAASSAACSSPRCRARACRGSKRFGEIETAMRIRHGLRLDQPNDFDMVTQDAILQVWDQISQGAFLALIVLSSIALMVGGIGVMSIMTMSVTERTREIGVRKALGARRVEILWQFLLEAVFLTSAGGLLGIAHRRRHRPAGACGRRASRSRCPGGRSRSASASRPLSACSSGWCPPFGLRAWTRLKRSDTNSRSSAIADRGSGNRRASISIDRYRFAGNCTHWASAPARR